MCFERFLLKTRPEARHPPGPVSQPHWGSAEPHPEVAGRTPQLGAVAGSSQGKNIKIKIKDEFLLKIQGRGGGSCSNPTPGGVCEGMSRILNLKISQSLPPPPPRCPRTGLCGSVVRASLLKPGGPRSRAQARAAGLICHQQGASERQRVPESLWGCGCRCPWPGGQGGGWGGQKARPWSPPRPSWRGPGLAHPPATFPDSVPLVQPEAQAPLLGDVSSFF